MSISLRLLALSAALAIGGAASAATPQTGTAAPAAKVRTAQQQRMADCNQQAKGKKGVERRSYMSSCLKGKGTAKATAPSARQSRPDRMKSCDADARTRELGGAERKSFMSDCLKGAATQ
ncbi:MAG: phosphate starvation-inducible protein PsiF [Xanthomonadaceae bacterium]|nr:phosphate starvation-inducible protein PsiF [Xanthomonadaceae bacterium]